MGLTVLVQVLHEVGLGLELPGQLLGGQVADAPLSAVWVWVLLHAWIVRIKIKTVRLYLGLRLNTRPTSGNVRNGELARLQVGQKCSSGMLAKHSGVHI